MNKIACRLQKAHEQYIYWYRILRDANDSTGLRHVTEQFSMEMHNAFAPTELFDIVNNTVDCQNVMATIPTWVKDEHPQVIYYRERYMVLCLDNCGQQNAIIYKDTAHSWPSLYDCLASVDVVIDQEIYHDNSTDHHFYDILHNISED